VGRGTKDFKVIKKNSPNTKAFLANGKQKKKIRGRKKSRGCRKGKSPKGSGSGKKKDTETDVSV